MKDYPNEEALRKAHRIYLDAMRPFIIRCLKRIPGRTLEDLIRDVSDYEPNDDILNVIDINNIPLFLRNHWYDIFSKEFNADLNVQNTTWLIVEGRNSWAHPGTDDIDSESTRTHLFHVARVLGEIKDSHAKQAVETIRDQLFSDEVEVHPAEVENAALKEDLSKMSDKIAKIQAEKNELEECLQDVQNELEDLKDMEAAWMDSEERLVGVSDELKVAKTELRASEKNRKAIVSKFEAVEAENTKLTADLNAASTWLEDVEKEKSEQEKRLKQLEKVEEEKAKLKKDSETAEWTIDRVRNSLSEEVRDYHDKYAEERVNLFYRGAVGLQNLIKKEGWELDMKVSKVPCSFFLKNKGVMGIKRIFGIILPVHLPHGSSVDRNGKVIGGSLKSTPPRLFVGIMEEEAEQLERQYGCEFCAVSKRKSVDFIYYYIPEDMSTLFPVLEFAYKKHRGN